MNDNQKPKRDQIDIHSYPAEPEGPPGTRVFTAQRARKGYNFNEFAMSLNGVAEKADAELDEIGELKRVCSLLCTNVGKLESQVRRIESLLSEEGIW